MLCIPMNTARRSRLSLKTTTHGDNTMKTKTNVKAGGITWLPPGD